MRVGGRDGGPLHQQQRLGPAGAVHRRRRRQRRRRLCGGTNYFGGDGDDRLVAGTRAVATGGVFDGGPGTDEVTWEQSDHPVRVGIGTGTHVSGRRALRDFHSVGPNVEIVTGSRLADMLTGSARADVFRPGHGDDVVFSGGGADRYEMLDVADGADTIVGSGRGDVVSYAGRTNPVRVVLGQAGRVHGEAGEGDFLNRVGGVEGGSAGDYLKGSRFADVLDGGPGIDTLLARSGNDRVVARDGRPDRIDCGAGRDVVVGDSGAEGALSGCERARR